VQGTSVKSINRHLNYQGKGKYKLYEEAEQTGGGLGKKIVHRLNTQSVASCCPMVLNRTHTTPLGFVTTFVSCLFQFSTLAAFFKAAHNTIQHVKGLKIRIHSMLYREKIKIGKHNKCFGEEFKASWVWPVRMKDH